MKMRLSTSFYGMWLGLLKSKLSKSGYIFAVHPSTVPFSPFRQCLACNNNSHLGLLPVQICVRIK